MTSFRIVIFSAVLFVASGCSSTNRAVPIDVPVEALEDAIKEANKNSCFQNSQLIPQEWWLLFDDSQLNSFVQKTFDRNPTLESARLQIFASTYNADKVRSSLYPYLSLGADVSRQKLSKTGLIPFASGPPGSGTPVIGVPTIPGRTSGVPEFFTLYETEFNLRYEFDFWGKNSNRLRAVLGEVQANIAEEAFTRLQLGIALTRVYYQLQIDYRREEISKAMIDNRLQYLDIVQQRVQSNLDNELSVQEASSSLIDARDYLLQIQADIAVNKYQLMAYMAGSFDEQIIPVDIMKQPLPMVSLPEDLPLHLIAQRPDIISQLWLIESAGRQIEVAKAGFYPDFNLTALFGFQTIHFAELFKWPSRYFNVDPAVSLPIFDGGLLVANLRESEVNYDAAILEYNTLVINAAKEVLDAIAILQNSIQRLNQFKLRQEQQEELYRLTRLRVSHSLNNSLDELISQQNSMIAQDKEVVAQGNAIQAILGLIKALGGGYENCEG